MTNIENKFLAIKQKLYPFGFRKDAWMLTTTTVSFLTGHVFAVWLFPTISLVFVGRIGTKQRDGCALALSVYALIGNAIVFGINFGCDTLLPQCYGGNRRKMGVILQRAVIIVLYACFPIWILMLNAKYVLKWIGTEENVVKYVNQFIQIFIFVVPLSGISSILRMYIATAGKTNVLIYIHLIGNGVNILSHYICLYQLNMGVRGAAVSLIIAFASLVILSILYIRFSSVYKETWYPITRACLQEWDIYLKLGIPGVAVMIVQIWAVELGVFFAAPLGVPSLSAQVTVQQMVWLVYMIALSLSDASDVVIGQYLGANKPTQAINAKNVTYILTIIVIIFNSALMVIPSRWTPYLFNTEPSALSLARNGLLVASIFSIFDALNATQLGIIKACGMQKYGVLLIFVGFYIFGLPLAYVFVFALDMDIYGFWVGMIIGGIVIDTSGFILIWYFDWNSISKEAYKHIRFIDPSIQSTNDSLSSDDTNENMQLLPQTANPKNDEEIGEYNAIQTPSTNNEERVNETSSNKSLIKVIIIQVVVLIIFICLFILTFIHSFK